MSLCHADCSFLQRQWLARGILGSHTVYIYICSVGCAQGYISPYMRICRLYMHIKSLKNIYRLYIYIYLPYLIFIFMLFVCCIYTNGCKWVLIYAPLHIRYSYSYYSRGCCVKGRTLGDVP